MVPHDEGLIQRHDARFTRIEDHLERLENRVTIMGVTVDDLDRDIYNHGKDGLKTILTNFIAVQKAVRQDREQREQRRRWVIATAIGALAVILTILSIIVVPAAKAILDDYYQRHPKAMVPKDSSYLVPEGVYAKSNDSVEHSAVE